MKTTLLNFVIRLVYLLRHLLQSGRREKVTDAYPTDSLSNTLTINLRESDMQISGKYYADVI
jgi:hypothetical protein